MKTFFDGETGMSVKKSYCGEHFDINVVLIKLRKTRRQRQKAKCIKKPLQSPLRFLASRRKSAHRYVLVRFLQSTKESRSYTRSLPLFQECSKNHYLQLKSKNYVSFII